MNPIARTIFVGALTTCFVLVGCTLRGNILLTTIDDEVEVNFDAYRGTGFSPTPSARIRGTDLAGTGMIDEFALSLLENRKIETTTPLSYKELDK